MAGADIKTVQERLGHSTATMTLNTYSHVLEGAQAQAAARAAMPAVGKADLLTDDFAPVDVLDTIGERERKKK